MILIFLFVIGLVLYLRNHNNVTKQPAPTSTIKQLPQQTNNSGSKSLTTSNLSNQGNSIDHYGNSPSPITTQQNQWVQSQSGYLTVKTPTLNSTISSGFILNGTDSTATNVNYRLIDNSTGVIAQGVISVVNGNFSATINFKSSGSSGRLDVFNTDSNGKEINDQRFH